MPPVTTGVRVEDLTTLTSELTRPPRTYAYLLAPLKADEENLLFQMERAFMERSRTRYATSPDRNDVHFLLLR